MSAPSPTVGLASWLSKNVPPFFWQPVTTTTARPASKSPEMLYVRSYLCLRTIIGALGVLLPLLVILGARYLFSESAHFPRTSISDYYYSGAREIFVDTLAATGVSGVPDASGAGLPIAAFAAAARRDSLRLASVTVR